MDRYILEEHCGAGSYASVDAMRDTINQKIVAIKKIFLSLENEISKTALREACLMFDLEHENIMRLERAFFHDNCLCLVMERMLMSLLEHQLLHSEKYPGIIKQFLKQLLLGISYCHSLGITHRDLKPENLLIKAKPEEGKHALKIADFGLARAFISADLSDITLSREVLPVLAMNAKAPEILLGSTTYSTAIDIWSIGCIFAMMVMTSKEPEIEIDLELDEAEDLDDSVHQTVKYLFVGETETSILEDIFSKLGTPNEETWPGVSSLPGWAHGFAQYPSQSIGELLPDLEPDGVDLLSKLLCLDPTKRISAGDALKHEYILSEDV